MFVTRWWMWWCHCFEWSQPLFGISGLHFPVMCIDAHPKSSEQKMARGLVFFPRNPFSKSLFAMMWPDSTLCCSECHCWLVTFVEGRAYGQKPMTVVPIHMHTHARARTHTHTSMRVHIHKQREGESSITVTYMNCWPMLILSKHSFDSPSVPERSH